MLDANGNIADSPTDDNYSASFNTKIASIMENHGRNNVKIMAP